MAEFYAGCLKKVLLSRISTVVNRLEVYKQFTCCFVINNLILICTSECSICLKEQCHEIFDIFLDKKIPHINSQKRLAKSFVFAKKFAKTNGPSNFKEDDIGHCLSRSFYCT